MNFSKAAKTYQSFVSFGKRYPIICWYFDKESLDWLGLKINQSCVSIVQRQPIISWYVDNETHDWLGLQSIITCLLCQETNNNMLNIVI